jgi:hypothetical protein
MLFLSGCTNTSKNVNDKTIPVYQGMELSKQTGDVFNYGNTNIVKLNNYVFLE